uniref:Steroid 5-alpha reductase C-terminal domain-containing protein n=1 Tax=Alexandrium catenella TaxID=2925 RepID=A0A7S1M2E0_ALECA
MIISLAHNYYIFDYFWNEPAILSTTDIRHEPFGFMLAWGDFGFLPWMYTNSFTLYLASVRPRYQGHIALDIACVLLWITAMALFRLTNIEKHNFRTYAFEHNNDPTGYKVWGKAATWIKTKEGSLMLTSGFWGMCRHPNYMPDLIMAVVWFLNCTAHPTVPIIPFGYVIYFWSMDIHRFFRDERRCRDKYKEDWDKYVQAVPYCLIPGVW